MSSTSYLNCILVAFCWGFTQPFLKKSDKYWYVFWMVVNLSGSVLYYYTLQDMQLSFAIPFIQGLSVLFNLAMSSYFDPFLISKRTGLGTALIVAAILIN